MIHILLTILKIILIIIAVILGIVLLTAAVLLLDPIRYRADIRKEEQVSIGETAVHGKVSWLFGILQVLITFENGKAAFAIRIFGKELGSRKSRKKKKRKKRTSADTNARSKPKAALPDRSGKPEDSVKNSKPEIKEIEQKTPEIRKEKNSDSRKPGTELPEPESDKAENPKPKKPAAGFFNRIRDKFKRTASRIKGMITNIEKWKQFMQDYEVMELLRLLWRSAKGLIRHILPTKVEGSLTFGLSDPSGTGILLGILGMSYPLHKNSVEIHPVWETEGTIYGNIHIRGRIYGIVVLIYALKLLLNKNLRKAIAKLRNRGK